MARLGSVHLAGIGAAGTFSVVVLAVLLRSPLPDYPDAEPEALAGSAAASAETSPLGGHPSISTRPTVTAAPRPTPATATNPISAGPSSEARDTWARMSKEMSAGAFKSAVSSLEQLLDQDSNAPKDRDVRNAIVELSQRIMLVEGDAPDRMFDLLQSKMGTTGIDILYEIMTTRGGSRAAARASAMLADPSVRGRGTPALQIAYDLFATKKCEDKAKLFARAGEDGDNRSLGQLALLNRSCRRRQPCCFHNDPDLKAAMDAIKNR